MAFNVLSQHVETEDRSEVLAEGASLEEHPRLASSSFRSSPRPGGEAALTRHRHDILALGEQGERSIALSAFQCVRKSALACSSVAAWPSVAAWNLAPRCAFSGTRFVPVGSTLLISEVTRVVF
jgi:hypothetical protein